MSFTSNLFVNVKWKCAEFTRISAAALINIFLQKCGAYLRAVLNTTVMLLNTVFTRISAAALINSPPPPSAKCGAFWSAAIIRVIIVIGNLRVYYIQDKLLLHLGQNVITFRVAYYI